MKIKHKLKKSLSVLLTVVLTVSMIYVSKPAEDVSAAGKNLITNGDFETGALASGYSGASVVTTPVHSGAYAAKVDAGATMQFITDGVHGGQLMDANKQYKMSAYVYVENDSVVRLYMPTWDTGWGNTQADADTIKDVNIPANTWTLLEYFVPVKTYQSLSEPRFSNQSGGVLYVDDITLAEWDGEFDFNGLNMGDDGNLTLNYTSLPSGYYADSAMYYKFNLVVDGVTQSAYIETYGGNFVTWGTDWYNGGNGAAQNSILIPAGTVFQQATPWEVIDGGKTLVTTKNFYYTKQADGTWLKTEYSNELSLSFSKIDGGNNWMFNRSEVSQEFLDGTYYQFSAYVDGVKKTLWLEFFGNETYIYASVIGTPMESLRIPEGTMLYEFDAVNTGTVVDGGLEMVLSETLYVEKNGDNWIQTAWVPKVTFGFEKVDNGNWWLTRQVPEDFDNKWYQTQVMVDGNVQTAWIEFISGYAYIYGHCFGGSAPTASLLVEEGTMLYESVALGDKVSGGATISVAETLYVTNTDGAWSGTEYSNEITLSFSKIDGNNHWMFNRSEVSQMFLDGTYYQFSAYVDGVKKTLWLEFFGNETYIYASVIGTPMESLRIPEGTMLYEFDAVNTGTVVDGGLEMVLSETLYVEKNGDNWIQTAWVPKVTFGFEKVDNGNWWLTRQVPEDFDNKWYQTQVMVDGNVQTAWIEFISGYAYIYGHCFGGSAPTVNLLIDKGAVLYESVALGDKVTDGKTLTVANTLYVINTDGTWVESVQTFETGIGFQKVESDNSWYLNLTDSSLLSTSYYKLAVTIDGKKTTILVEKSGNGIVIWPSFFAWFDGTNTVPSSSFLIEKDAVLIPLDANNGWSVMDSENEVTITNTLEVTVVNGIWAVSKVPSNITLGYVSSGDNNWQLSADTTNVTGTYYITTVVIDGKEVLIPIEKNATGFIIWSNYFSLIDNTGVAPTKSFAIEKGAIFQQIDPAQTGWTTAVSDGQWLKLTDKFEVLSLGSGWGSYSTEKDTKDVPIYFCVDNDMSYLVTSSTGAYEIVKDGVVITDTELTEEGSYQITRIENDMKIVQTVVLYKTGNVNDNGSDVMDIVDSKDLVAVKWAALNGHTNTINEQKAADINLSNSVDALDARAMRKALVTDDPIAYLSKVKGNTSLNGEMPIIGFDGPSTDFLEGKDADAIYAMIDDLGINTVLMNRDEIGTNYAFAKSQLQAAEKYGLKLYLNNGYVFDETNPDGIGATLGANADTKLSQISAQYDGYTSFGGYYIYDEPMYNAQYNGRKHIGEFDVPLTTTKKYTNIHSYLNLAPYIAGAINSQFGGSASSAMSYDNYKQYVDATSSAGAEALSYDMYLRGNGITSGFWLWETTSYKIHTEDFWKNLDWMRTIASEDTNNNPFYAFVQVGNDFSDENKNTTSVDNLTTIQEMYFEANAALAMGAKGLNYYSLVQPKEYSNSTDGTTDYTRSGLINYEGNANNGGSHGANYRYYDAAKKINTYIKKVDEVLMNARSTAVVTTNSTVAGYLANEGSSYGSLKSINNTEVMVGCFDYYGQEVFMVVNITPDSGNSGSLQTVTLSFDGEQNYNYTNMNCVDSTGTGEELTLEIGAGESVLVVLE